MTHLYYLKTGIPPFEAVYMLVSNKRRSQGYVGQTINFRRRLTEHQSGHGAQQTADPRLRPWVPVIVITGFPEENREQHLRACEAAWRNYNNHGQSGRCDYSPNMLKNGVRVFQEYLKLVNHDQKPVYPDLRLLQFTDLEEESE
jgi:predicted GIY-YIG superfamily endonuclease